MFSKDYSSAPRTGHLRGELVGQRADELAGGAAAGVRIGALGVLAHILQPVELKHLLRVLPQPRVGNHDVLEHLWCDEEHC